MYSYNVSNFNTAFAIQSLYNYFNIGYIVCCVPPQLISILKESRVNKRYFNFCFLHVYHYDNNPLLAASLAVYSTILDHQLLNVNLST